MLQISYIREYTEELLKNLSKRNKDFSAIINQIIEKDNERRQVQHKSDTLLAELNTLSKQIGELFKKDQTEEANRLKTKSVELKEESKKITGAFEKLDNELDELLVLLPNVPDESVPAGKSSEDNFIAFSEGKLPELPGSAKPHWEIVKEYDIIDFETGTKITGAGFPVYKNKGARLQRALINFFLDEAIKAGYTEYQPPFLVNAASGFGTGQLPDKEGQMYCATADELYLIPTAEVPITNIFRDMILPESLLPVKCCAYSACFRREAGSWGKEVRGLNRLHQFDKVEIVQIQHPEKSFKALEEMVEHVKGLLRKLELPFRTVKLCGGDLGFASAMTYDFEVYAAAQKKWLEVSSVSNFLTFQSNRMKLRFRAQNNKSQLAHTLNGSALALPRTVAALLENNQSPEGIRLPKALTHYTGFEVIEK